jgi:hypothetical protein
MPFYSGTTADWSDAKRVAGMYINPDNPNEWSSMPYPQQIKEHNMMNEVSMYANGRFCLDDIRQQIINKTCPLSARLRRFVLSLYDESNDQHK